MEDIKCPKCGSTQLTADKKGFSGKKAVAGAALTGGIGLLAGTIGSNKIKITCLKCGHQFSPGEDMESQKTKNLKRKELNAKIAKSPIYKTLLKIILGLLVILILIIILASIFSSSENKNATITNSTSDSTKYLQVEKYFTIEKENNDGANIQLSIYVSDTSKIKEINRQIINKYNSGKSKGMLVAYFNKKGIGKTYFEKQTNDNISEKEKDKLFENFIAEYNLNPQTNYDTLSYMHK